MASTFSIGVLVSGAMASSFMSTMSGTQRTLDKLGTTSQKLTTQQDKLTRATERYGQLGGRAAQRLNSDLERVSRTLQKMEGQQARLAKWTATGASLKNNRMALYAQGAETYALGRAALAPAMSAVTNYASYEAEARNIRVTGDLTAAQENSLRSSMLTNASTTGQFSGELLKGVGIQVAAGMDAGLAQAQAGTMGRVATANQAAIEDLAKLGNAFKQINITKAPDLARAYDAAGWGATQGNFELKDMAKAMPQMFSAFKSRGIVGPQANAEIVASLEAGREGAGSNDEAVTNMSNWLSHMGSQDTTTKYKKAGIDYQGSMNQLVAGGFSQYEASLEIARTFINSKGKAFADKWKNAQGDMTAQQKLAESFGLSEVFTDMQTVNHLVAMTQNWDKYQEIKKGMLGKASEGFTDKAFALQMDTVKAKTQQASIELDILSKTVGSQLAPSFSGAVTTLVPYIRATTKWVSEHPAAISALTQVVVGIVGFRLAIVGAKLSLNLFLSPLVSTITTLEHFRSRWQLIRNAFSAGGIFRRVASGAAGLARVLSGGLLKGIMLVSRAALFMGRAMLMNPIGLIITGIAVGAYLIYRYWGPISTWFKSRWADIKTAFSGGISGVAALIINWSPLGLFYKAFAGVMRYFKIDMPRNFTEFGSNIVSGLVSGIENKWNEAKDKISSLGSSIKDWFTDPLKIKSPSRVFMGYGDNLVQGLVMGVDRSANHAEKATKGLAARMVPELPGIPAGRKISPDTPSFNEQSVGLQREMPHNIAGLGGNLLDELTRSLTRLMPVIPERQKTTPEVTFFSEKPAGLQRDLPAVPRDVAGLGGNLLDELTRGLTQQMPLLTNLLSGISEHFARPVPDLNHAASYSDQTPKDLAARTIPELPAIPDIPGGASSGGNAMGRSGGIVVHFSPSITIDGKTQEPAGAVRDALNIGMNELEKMLERLMNQKQRRAFD